LVGWASKSGLVDGTVVLVLTVVPVIFAAPKSIVDLKIIFTLVFMASRKRWLSLIDSPPFVNR